MNTTFTLTALVLAVAALAVAAQPVAGPADVVIVALPRGNVVAGRQAFRDLRCGLCHQVAGETQFPAPVSASRGPDLGGALRMQSPSDVAAAIVEPSHSLSVRTSDALKERLTRESVSPMGDFSATLTVRQVADLMAYLLSQTARQ
jgi:mono/diheme cytochrome c family protein